jgi:hypothetical protein
VIRRASPKDAEAVVRIFRESRAEAMPLLPVLHTEAEDLAWYRERLGGEAWVYELEDRVVGFALVREDDLDAVLFRQAQEARPAGFGWWVFRDNMRARRFYESLGGRLLYETDGTGNEEKTPDVRYEWRPTHADEEA